GRMSWRSGVAVRSEIKVVLPMQLRVSMSLAVADTRPATRMRRCGLAAAPFPTTFGFSFGPEVGDQTCELFVFGIEVGQRQVESSRQSLLDLQGRLMDALLVAIDAGAGDKLIHTHFDT